MRRVRAPKANSLLPDPQQAAPHSTMSWLRSGQAPLVGLALFGLLMTFFATVTVFAKQGGSPTKVQASSSPVTGTRQALKPYPVYGPLQIKSIEAKGNDPKAVQALVDEVFRQTGFENAAPSLRARVTRAELAYRAGLQKSVDTETFVRAFNKTVGAFPLPGYFKTSRDQVSLQQLFVHAHAPNGLWDQDDNPEMLAPSEVTFYTLFMAYQKFFNPWYQMDADKWASRQRALIANRPSAEFLKLQRRLKVRDNLLPQYNALRFELALEKSDATREGHALFDRLGFVK